MQKRHERPIRRVNPSGEVVWLARYTDRDGKRRSAGTYKLRGACKAPSGDGRCCAQHAIDAAYEREATAPRRPDTVGAYAETWTQRHPRSARTNKTNEHRVGRVLGVEVEGVELRHWPFADLRRRHALELVDHLLRVQKRSATGATGIIRALSAMAEDAITDEVTDLNAFKGVKVRAADPRVTKAPKKVHVWTWEQMHGFAAAAGAARTGRAEPSAMDEWRQVYAETMIRVLADCGLRLGELLPLYRRDVKLGAGQCDEQDCDVTVPHLHVRRTTHNGLMLDGTKTDHGHADAGRQTPLPDHLVARLRALPPRIDTQLLFPTPTGALWRERNWYRDVWDPARLPTNEDGIVDRSEARSGPWAEATPHHFRHSWISLLSAAGVDPAELAQIAGHTVATMHGVYTHGLGRSHEAIRKAVGE